MQRGDAQPGGDGDVAVSEDGFSPLTGALPLETALFELAVGWGGRCKHPGTQNI